jgi:hypothetical protein
VLKSSKGFKKAKNIPFTPSFSRGPLFVAPLGVRILVGLQFVFTPQKSGNNTLN